MRNGSVDVSHSLITMQNAQAQRNALLDSLIDAIIDSVEDELIAPDAYGGDSALNWDTSTSHLKPFEPHQPCQQSRSLEFSRSLLSGGLRLSTTMHTFSNASVAGTLESLRISPLPWSTSYGAVACAGGKATRVLTSSADDADASNGNPRDTISHWIDWATGATRGTTHAAITDGRTEALRESLKHLLSDASLAMIDDSVHEADSLSSDASSSDDVVFL
ncbi:hypothetical protein AAVH_37195 [Aphelenchoides avenae]|nr:hypothetical protein AAVH_37195 [Aphelenchus avenae]